jgi:hypothetical protein
MGEVGRWDDHLFAEFRFAHFGSERRRTLLGELIRINEPLIKMLVAQLGGKPPPKELAPTRFNSMRVPGAEDLDWTDALNAGRLAFVKAMEIYDPRKRLAIFLKWKMRHELQTLVRGRSIVKAPKNKPTPTMEHGEDDAHFDRLVASTFHEDNVGSELPRIAGTGIVLRDVKPANQVVPHDDRPALQVLLEEHLRFAPGARVSSTAVRGRFRSIAQARGEHANERALLAELRARGVRSTHVRTPWSAAAFGFAGVTLQTASPRPAAPRTGVSGACLASPPGG